MRQGFHINISDTLPDLFSNGLPGVTISPAADLHVPDSVSTIKLLSLSIILTFSCIQDRAPPSPGKQYVPTGEMLLEDYYDGPHDAFEDIMDVNESDFQLSQPKTPFEAGCLVDSRPWSESLFVEDGDIADIDDDLLLYHPGHTDAPSLTSQESISSGSQQSTKSYGLTGPSTFPNLGMKPSLKVPTARQLTDVAIRTLLGGRQTKFVPSIRIGAPRPAYPLSSIMPLLWSPGFQNVRRCAFSYYLLTLRIISLKLMVLWQVMSQRCQFLSTISNAMASLTKTGQSPSLHRKLALIQEMVPARNTPARPLSLSQTMQAQLFRMMHISLYEPITARRLRPAKFEDDSQTIVKENIDEGAIVEGIVDEEMIIDAPSQTHEIREETDERISEPKDFADAEFEDIFDEELLSDDEIDMLFDLEILRNQTRENTRGSCSMLLQSEDGCGDATGRNGEDDSVLLLGDARHEEENKDILEGYDSWDRVITDGGVEDVVMMMDSRHPEHQDNIYIRNESMLI